MIRRCNGTIIMQLLAVMLLVGCKSDRPAMVEADINGTWSVHTALRNQKVTRTLKDGYFVFEADTSLTTNVWGTKQMYTFEKEGNLLRTVSGEPALQLRLKSASTDSLIFTSKVKSFDMEFQLVRDTIGSMLPQ